MSAPAFALVPCPRCGREVQRIDGRYMGHYPREFTADELARLNAGKPIDMMLCLDEAPNPFDRRMT